MRKVEKLLLSILAAFKHQFFLVHPSFVFRTLARSIAVAGSVLSLVFTFCQSFYSGRSERALFTKSLVINSFLLKEYFAILFFVLVCVAISYILYFVAKNVSAASAYNEKSGPYECGFEAFSDARGHVNVQFYVVALLFVIFDVEVIYFLPWAVNLQPLGFCGFLIMSVFNLFLAAGFIYEWSRGVFNWARPGRRVLRLK
jgi:NADH-quinone oxidoreductase subunit A